MGKWEGLNRRKFPRVSYPCLVVIRNNKGAKEVILTHTENIGIGGVCVILKQNVEMFSPVEVELDLLDMNEHIKCEGKVVWTVRRKMNESKKPLFYDIGIEFQNLPKKTSERIEEVILRLAKHHKV